MATYYVDSAAVGANNGTSWVNAWVSIDSFLTLPPANNDVCLVDDGHSEDLGGNKTYAIVTAAETPFKIHCVDKADDSLSTGAVVDNGGVGNDWDTEIGGSLYCYGITLSAGGHIGLDAGDNTKQIWENCALDPGNNVANTLRAGEVANGVNNEVHLVDCTVTLAISALSYVLAVSRCFVSGGSISGGNGNPVVLSIYEGTSCKMEGVDLSSINGGTGAFRAATGTKRLGRMLAESCKVPAGATVVSGAILSSHRYEMMHCESGTPADPSYEMEIADYWGTTKASAARYRSDGASDKVRSSPYSWEMVATVKAQEIYCPHESPPLAGWTDGDGAKEFTYTIYFASDATMQDDEFWAELSVPNDDDTSSQVKILSSRLDPQSTPANVGTDAFSTWNGAGVGTMQKIVFSHVPDKPGPIEARLFLAKASDTVYIDPKIYVGRVLSQATSLDGVGAYYTLGSDLNLNTNEKVGFFACWFKIDGGNGADRYLLVNNTGRFLARFGVDNKTRIVGLDIADGLVYSQRGSTAYVAGPTWYNWLASWDLVNSKSWSYINDVSDVAAPTIVNTDIDYTATAWGVGATPGGANLFNVTIARLFFALEYLDITVEANRRRIIRADGTPALLGPNGEWVTGNQPIVYAPDGDPSNNLGYGGNFVAQGAPAATSFLADIKPDMAAQGRANIVPGYGTAQEGEPRMLVGPGMGGGLK